jgi:hypothetical protein
VEGLVVAVLGEHVIAERDAVGAEQIAQRALSVGHGGAGRAD